MSDIWDNLLDELSAQLAWRISAERNNGHYAACQSPIEEAFLAAFKFHGVVNSYTPIVGLPTSEQVAEATKTGSLHMFIVPQWPVENYRADFLVGFACDGSHRQTSIIVELDGHQWHEKTKDQARRDKERDRILNNHVAKVIHFTGSEVFRSPLKCVETAQRMVDQCYFAFKGIGQ